MIRVTDEENTTLVIKTGIEQLLAPYKDLLARLLGPAADEIGLSVADSAKVWRLRRQIRLYSEVKRMIEESCLSMKPIPPRLFFPILQGGSTEDDDDMQSRWAALLANAATTPDSVHPAFIEILRQLSPQDARSLDSCYDHCIEHATTVVSPRISLFPYKQVLPAGNHAYGHDNLIRLGLIQPSFEVRDRKGKIQLIGNYPQRINASKIEHNYEMSWLAFGFVKACRAPKKDSPPQK
jgi:hypothetical protein